MGWERQYWQGDQLYVDSSEGCQEKVGRGWQVAGQVGGQPLTPPAGLAQRMGMSLETARSTSGRSEAKQGDKGARRGKDKGLHFTSVWLEAQEFKFRGNLEKCVANGRKKEALVPGTWLRMEIMIQMSFIHRQLYKNQRQMKSYYCI